jgi:polysaccharide biosynthesis/export protein
VSSFISGSPRIRTIWPSAAALCAILFLLPVISVAQFNGPPSTQIGPETGRPTTLTTDRKLLFPGMRDLKLTPGDLINIHLFGDSEYAPSVRIGNDGTVLLPLIGIISLQDLTVSQAEELIEQKLRDAGMYRNPQITIQIAEGPNAVVTIVGEAHGVIPITGSRRLFDVLVQAGGLPATASHVITIHRAGQTEPIVVDLGSDPLHTEMGDIPVFPGDTIVVSRIGVVYIVGAFKTSGTIALNQYSPLTLTQAAALSGGPDYTAKYDDLRLIRTEGDHRTVVKLDIKKVLYGQAPDPILQPNDLLFLPQSAWKASLQNGTAGYLLGLTGLMISILDR